MDLSQVLDLVRKAQASGNPEALAKAVTTATGLVQFDLQRPSKNLYPVYTPLRNRIPRVAGNGGTATNWRQVSAITGSGYDSMGWVPEGVRSGVMSYTTANKSATYVTIGEEDSLTFEAQTAANGFEDLNATVALRLLQKMMLKEEYALLAGNTGLALGTTPTPTLSAGGSGGTLPGAPTTYSVICVALTLEGYKGAISGIGATPVLTQTKTVTSADGSTYVINGGCAQASAAATQAITLGQILSCSVTAVRGAVAYCWFVGTAGAEKFEKVTTINSVTFSAPLLGTGTAASALVAADYSANTTVPAFNGLLTAAGIAANGAYWGTQATGTAGTGTVLTASGRGSVVEIDTMLQTMWDNYQVSPSVLLVNSQQLKDITTKVLGTGSAPLLQYFADPEKGARTVAAGGGVEFYFNPFQIQASRIPIVLHPFVPNGTILGWAENLPMQYQSNETPNVAEVKTRRDYYQINWPIKTRKYEMGVYAEEVLAVYAPFAMGVITNIAAG